MANRQVAVHLVARVGQYIAAMQAAQAATLSMAGVTQSSLTKVGGQMMAVGKKMTLFVSVPLAAAAAGSVKAAIDWESAWAGVDKTVEGTAGQMAQLEQGLRDMAKELPATHEEIAAVAQAAGALGVETPNILGFTKVMIDLGEATDDLDAHTAATEIAQLMNIMQTSADDVDNLGAALVDLGNNGASTEGQILNMAHRIAGAAHVVGMSEQDVLGLANAMSSLGIEAELGGSAISRAMVEINRSVSTGGQKLELFAQTAGMSAQQFADLWREKPTEALVAFIDGLARLDASGGNVDLLLKDLSLNGLRVSDTLKRLMGSGDLLTDSLDRSNRAWDENIALTNEAERRYATTASQFEVVRNKIVDLAIDLGAILLPFVEKAVDFAGELATAFQGLPTPIQAVVMASGGLLATLGPLLIIGGSLVKNFALMKGVFSVLGGGIMSASSAFVALNAALILGFVAYQGFTQKSREADEATRATVAALNTQFPALVNSAVAAAEAGEEIDSLRVSSQALTQALAEGEQDAVRALAEFNMEADDLLGVLVGIDRGGVRAASTLQSMARNFGLNAEQAGHFVYMMQTMTFDEIADDAGELSAELGISEEMLGQLVGAFFAFEQASASVDLERITTEFLRGRIAAMGYEDSMVKAAEAAAGVTRLEDDPVAVYHALTQELLNATAAEREAAGITDEVAAEMAALTPMVEDAAGGFTELAESGIEASKAFEDIGRAVQANWMQQLRELSGLQGPADGWINVLGLTEIEQFGVNLHRVLDPQQEFIRSQDAIWQASFDFADALEDNNLSLDENTRAGSDNRAMLMDWMDAILAGADAQLANGDSIRDVNNTLEYNVDQLRKAAYAAGFNKTQVDNLIDTYLNVPESVETAVKLNGEDIAMQKIEDLLLEMEVLDEGVVAEVLTIAETEGAWAAYHFLVNYINSHSATLTLQANTAPIWNAINAIRGAVILLRLAQGFAEGGYVNRPTPGVFGEAGPEVVLPLTNPRRMKELMAMPQVAGPISAAMGYGWMPMHGWSSGGSGSTVIQNVTVNMPAGSDGDDVVRALRRWERQRGPIPISTR